MMTLMTMVTVMRRYMMILTMTMINETSAKRTAGVVRCLWGPRTLIFQICKKINIGRKLHFGGHKWVPSWSYLPVLLLLNFFWLWDKVGPLGHLRVWLVLPNLCHRHDHHEVPGDEILKYQEMKYWSIKRWNTEVSTDEILKYQEIVIDSDMWTMYQPWSILCSSRPSWSCTLQAPTEEVLNQISLSERKERESCGH